MKFLKKFLELIFTTKIKCIFCGEELNGTTSNCTCNICLNKLPFIIKSCPRCGVNMNKEEEGVCFNCKNLNYNFKRAIARLDYSKEVIKVLHKFKFGGLKFLAEPLAGFMREAFAVSNIEADVICAVPIHANRLKERGFNQSELLANFVSKTFKIPYLNLCSKVKENPSQTTLDFKLRKENVKDVYEFNKQHKTIIKGLKVLLIDDIFTTGATCNEVAGVLLKAGAKEVNVLTIAHTPLPKDRI